MKNFLIAFLFFVAAAFGQSGANRLNVVPFSANPVFDASLAWSQKITLTGNVTSSSFVNLAAGQTMTVMVCQDSTGGRTFTWPTSALGTPSISTTANTCTTQAFLYDGLNANATGGSSGTGSNPSCGGNPCLLPSGVVQSGLVGEYRFLDGSGTSLSDSSGVSGAGTLCAAGAAPTWTTAANGGGLTFNAASSQCVTLPAALNSAVTIQLFLSNQFQNVSGTGFYEAPITGNGAAANTATLLFVMGTTNPGFSNTGSFFQANIIGYGAGGFNHSWRDMMTGTGLVSWVQDATNDSLYFNNRVVPCAVVGCTGGNAGRQTAGVYQLGGRPSGYVNGNSSFWSGSIYYAVFYNRALTPAEVTQNSQVINATMAARGVPSQIFGNSSYAGNGFYVDGDSLPSAGGGWFTDAFPLSTTGTWQAFYPGRSGQGVVLLQSNAADLRVDGYAPGVGGTGFCMLDIQIGTNDLGGTASTFVQQLTRYIQQRKALWGGCKIILNTILDKGGQSASKNTYNNLERANWRSMGVDYLADVAANPNIGCDGCNANGFFNVDTIHPNAVGQAEIAEVMQRTINRILGNNDFNSANTYTTAAPAATAITAATEATNTVTLTFAATPANFLAGTDLTVAGVTPAGYNGTNICHIVTRTGTQVTCLNPNVSLGAGSVFGTAIAPQQLDQDVYVILGGSAAGNPSFTLESCQGWTTQNIYIKNTNTTSAWVLTPNGSETIDGAATLTMPTASSGNFPVVVLQSTINSASAGTCFWKRIQ